MHSEGLGSLGFWIFIAAVVAVSIWRDARQKSEKHETLRRIVEKTGTVDEAKLKELFSSAPALEQKPGSGYRALRVLGTVVMFIAAAIFAFFSIFAVVMLLLGKTPPSRDIEGMIAAFVVPIAIAIFGYGLFFASRFAEPPSR